MMPSQRNYSNLQGVIEIKPKEEITMNEKKSNIREVSQILNDINEINEKKSLIEKEIAEKKAIVDEKKQIFAKSLIAEAGKERKSSSLKTQKRILAEATIDLESVQAAAEVLDSSLVDLETERGRSELFFTQAVRFKKAMAECKGSHGQLGELLESLKGDLQAFNHNVDNLIKGQEQAVGAFGTLYQEVDLSLSLRAFLDGQILEVEDSDKDAVLAETRARVMELTAIDFEAIESEFITFQESMGKLSQFRKFINSKDKLSGRHKFVYKGARQSDVVSKISGESPLSIAARVRQHPERYDDATLQKYNVEKKRDQVRPVFGT